MAAEPVDKTGAGMRLLIDGIFAEVPNAVIILSTLLPTDHEQANVDNINNQYRALAREYNPSDEPTFKVVLADMAGTFITLDDIIDGHGTHPTTEGQRKMAAVWDWEINQASEKGWISEPSESSRFSDDKVGTDCRKEFVSGNADFRAGREILFASDPLVKDDGTYTHTSLPREDRGGKGKAAEGSPVYFAQLINHENKPKGGERDEAIYVTGDSEDRRIWYATNNGDGTFSGEHDLHIEDACKIRGKCGTRHCGAV